MHLQQQYTESRFALATGQRAVAACHGVWVYLTQREVSKRVLNTHTYFQPAELEDLCVQTFQMATGRKAMPAKSGSLLHSPYRLLIRVGLLGPALGGQCILDFPLLTALNLCSLQMCGRSFSSLAQESSSAQRDMVLKQLLGLPYPGSAQIYRCRDPWIKRVEINLGPMYQHEILKLAVIDERGKPVGLRAQIGPEKEQKLNLDARQCAELVIEERRFLLRVVDLQTIEMDLDETPFTLGSLPPQAQEHHLIVELDHQPLLVKSAGSLVKSSLLEIANQVAPSLIPSHLTGDISTPKIIPLRAAHLPLPNLRRFHVEVLLMGAGAVRVQLELGPISGLNARQLDILKALFDYTFYHPELKKIFGS